MSSIDESIARAQRDITILQGQIHENKGSTNDTTLADAAASAGLKDVSGLALFPRRTLRGHLAKVYSASWAQDSKQIVTASQDGNLLVWNAFTTYKSHAIALRSHWVMTCTFDIEGTYVACGGLDNLCSLYDIRKKDQPIKVSRELSGHGGYVSCCRFVHQNQILTSSGDMSCILWDVENGKMSRKFTDHTGDVMCVAISPDKNTFVSGGCDTHAKVWDVRTGTCVQTLTGHTADINSIRFFPNGQAFATGSDDMSCRLFDLRASRELMKYQDPSLSVGVTSLDFSKSGRLLFVGYDQNKAVVWDTMSGKLLTALTGHEGRISCVEVSPDGSALCTGSWDHTLKIWA